LCRYNKQSIISAIYPGALKPEKFTYQGEKMDQTSTAANTSQIAIAKTMLSLENQLKGGVSWFFWIAGLSIINSIIFFTGGSITFVVGLGATQFIDGVVSGVVNKVSSGTGTIIRVIGYGLDFLLAGTFFTCGILGRKRLRWVVIGGMILYGLDGLLALAFGDWLSTIFHVLALFGLWKGQKAIKELGLLEKNQSAGDLAAIQMMVKETQPVSNGAPRKNLVRFLLIVTVPFLILLGVLIVMILLNYK